MPYENKCLRRIQQMTQTWGSFGKFSIHTKTNLDSKSTVFPRKHGVVKKPHQSTVPLI
jgi:hypothetical protein